MNKDILQNKRVVQVYQIDGEDLINFFETGVLIERLQDLCYGKYENTEVSSRVICGIWNITPQTLTSYIKAGIVKPLNPGSSNYKFNLAAILKMENPKNKKITFLKQKGYINK